MCIYKKFKGNLQKENKKWKRKRKHSEIGFASTEFPRGCKKKFKKLGVNWGSFPNSHFVIYFDIVGYIISGEE